MRTLLVLSRHGLLSQAIESVLDSTRYQVITKEDVWEAESLLSRGAIDAAILDIELTNANAIRAITEIREAAPRCPLLVYTSAKQSEWEEDAYTLGVAHVLAKPVRAKLLNTLLDRALNELEQHAQADECGAASQPLKPSRVDSGHFRALEALRNFSGVLAHSLNCEALLKEFLLLLREIIGVNRAVIFLRKPAGVLSESAHAQDDRWLRSACAIGLETSFLEHFALSLGAGIGASLRRQGRILKANSLEAQSNREITKEFHLLGAQVAIPILDREALIGVAVFDERLTGEAYQNDELSLIFHMLEEVGLAIRNSWLHDQIVSSHRMVANILGTLGSGCMVVDSALQVLHANVAARKYFLPENSGKLQPLEFSHLPQELGSKVFTVMKTGVGIPPFMYQFPTAPDAFFQVTISPFNMENAASTGAALLTIEDVTQREHGRKLEIEASNLRLVTSMAEHLAHEIGNSVVPLSTHQQLLNEKYSDPEFRESLSTAMASGVKRISRLANQMMFLAREKTDFSDKIPVADLISEAFRDAYSYHAGKAPQLDFKKASEPWTIAGDHKALRHAFSEVILNALQANPSEPNVAVKINEDPSDEGNQKLNVEVRDSGGGFTPETAEKAQEPFFSTRNVGLGIGLTVTRKIIEDHKGKVTIAPSEKGGHGMVRISLPLAEQN